MLWHVEHWEKWPSWLPLWNGNEGVRGNYVLQLTAHLQHILITCCCKIYLLNGAFKFLNAECLFKALWNPTFELELYFVHMLQHSSETWSASSVVHNLYWTSYKSHLDHPAVWLHMGAPMRAVVLAIGCRFFPHKFVLCERSTSAMHGARRIWLAPSGFQKTLHRLDTWVTGIVH